MTNGIGATIGTLVAQKVINHFTWGEVIDGNFYTIGNWSTCWYIFAAYALLIGVLFALIFRPEKSDVEV